MRHKCPYTEHPYLFQDMSHPRTSSPPMSSTNDHTRDTSSTHNLEHAAEISKRDTLRVLDKRTIEACNAMQAQRLLLRKTAKEGNDITAHLLEFESLWEHINQTYPSFRIEDNFKLCLKVAISLPPSWEPFTISLLNGIDKEQSNIHDFITECIRENEKHEGTHFKDSVYKGNAQADMTCWGAE